MGIVMRHFAGRSGYGKLKIRSPEEVSALLEESGTKEVMTFENQQVVR